MNKDHASYIYSTDVPLVMRGECGYFEPKSTLKLPECFNYQYAPVNIGTSNRLLYFPGSFGTFHEGHMSVVESALKHYGNDSIVVIAPSNSDYLVDKYGPWSMFSRNRERYEAIRHVIPRDWFIDIRPMMQYECDQNFTDLLRDFQLRYGFSGDSVVLCGKDREDFKLLEKFTDKIEVFHGVDTTGASTSKTIEDCGKSNLMFKKRACALRYTNKEELELFKDTFHDQYENIVGISLDHELAWVKQKKKEGAKYTICKDYMDVLKYIPLNRNWFNPFEQTGYNGWERLTMLPENSVVIDSDIFSGGTKKFLASLDIKLEAFMDVSDMDNVEIVDFNDFLYQNYVYPLVDVSSRCSMQAFDYSFHQRFNNFIKEAGRI